MYAIDIRDRTTGSDVFSEMVAWLEEVIGPKISENSPTTELGDDRVRRTFKIEGTGWCYEYHSIRICIDDTRDFELPKLFHYESNNAGGSNLYASKVMYIENLINAMEFKLRW
jgi:hypothetical protein